MRVRIFLKATGASLLFSSLLSGSAMASGEKPGCAEKPERRDCVKVEQENAEPPKATLKPRRLPAVPVQRPAGGGN